MGVAEPGAATATETEPVAAVIRVRQAWVLVVHPDDTHCADGRISRRRRPRSRGRRAEDAGAAPRVPGRTPLRPIRLARSCAVAPDRAGSPRPCRSAI